MLFPYVQDEPADLTEQERARLEALRRFQSTGSGWSEFDRGGHFAAMEVPDLLVGDVRAFFRPLR